MNPRLSRLQPYPFERLKALFAGVTPNPALAPISLGIGEPRHAPPEFNKQPLDAAMSSAAGDMSSEPATTARHERRDATTAGQRTLRGVGRDPARRGLRREGPAGERAGVA